MRSKFLYLLPVFIGLFTTSGHANWQYSGTYVGDGWYSDDGARFVMSFRGGASLGMGRIKNDIGELTPAYYYVTSDGSDSLPTEIFPAIFCGEDCDNYDLAGFADLGSLPVNKNFESFAFTAGASLGWTIPHHPQWRIEAGWDHIVESDYNASPFLKGETQLFGGMINDTIIVPSGSVQSKISTNIISAMAFYDFYDGLYKPLRSVIPYVGFGIGYADVKTTLNLSDPYGDLSSVDLEEYGERDDKRVIHFYKSETDTSTVAGLVALGISYGISERLFLDFGGRVAYIPRVKWTLTDADGNLHRDWFSAENLIYTNVTIGVRVEF